MFIIKIQIKKMSTSNGHIRSANVKKKQSPQFSLPSLRQMSGNKVKVKSPNQDQKNFNQYIFHQQKNYHKPYSGNPSVKYNQKGNNIFFNTKKIYHRDITTANPNPIMIKNLFYNVPSNINYNNYNYFFQKNNRQSNIINSNGNLNNNISSNNNGSFRQKPNFAKSLPRSTKRNFNNSLNVYSSIAINPNKILTPTSHGMDKHSQKIKDNNKMKPYKEFFYLEDKNLEHRKTMEDFHCIIPKLGNDASKSYFAIFDGHSGSGPAIYCSENLHTILSKFLYSTNFNVEKSLINSFSKIDNDINETSGKSEAGTTATVVFIFQEYNSQKGKNQRVLFCANVGDSKCFLIKKNNTIIQLSKDHKCSDVKEVDRIKKCGGIVFGGRVYGTLMLTRTIGDKEMKKYGVVSTPTVTKVEIDDENDMFVVIASDGLWDVVDENDLKNVCIYTNTAESICKQLLKNAKEGDTRDNVSCIVVKL